MNDEVSPRKRPSLSKIACKRSGHIAVAQDNLILVWGGFKTNHSTIQYYPNNKLMIYNCSTGVWYEKQTNGNCLPPTSGSTGLALDDFLYIFGGQTEGVVDFHQRHSNRLYRLSLTTLTWEELSPKGPRPVPCDKNVGWVHNKKLYFFGGHGPRPSVPNCDFQMDLNVNPFLGWNNSFIGYNTETNEWFFPKTKGLTPEPRAAHSASIMGSKAFIFGGRFGDHRVNHLYSIDLDSMTWSVNLNEGLSRVPEGRSWTSFNFVSPTNAVVYGGLREFGIPAMDYWECTFFDDLTRVEWTKCIFPISPRVWHQAAFSESTGLLALIGGVSQSPQRMVNKDFKGDMVVFNYKPPMLARLCLDALVKWVDDDLLSAIDQLPNTLKDIYRLRLSQTDGVQT